MSTLTTAVDGIRLVARGPITPDDGGRGFIVVHAVDEHGATLGVWTLPGRGWLVVAVPLIASARVQVGDRMRAAIVGQAVAALEVQDAEAM